MTQATEYPRLVCVVDRAGNGVYRNLVDTSPDEDVMHFVSGYGWVSKYQMCMSGLTVVPQGGPLPAAEPWNGA